MEISRYFSKQPLPERAFLPGTGMPRPQNEVLPALGETDSLHADWPASPAFLYGADLFNAGFFWEAHEQWEVLWRAAARQTAEHALLQGLIQAAASILKASLEQRDGAIRLALAANEHLRAGHSGVDLTVLGFSPATFAAELLHWAHDLAEGKKPSSPALRLQHQPG